MGRFSTVCICHSDCKKAVGCEDLLRSGQELDRCYRARLKGSKRRRPTRRLFAQKCHMVRLEEDLRAQLDDAESSWSGSRCVGVRTPVRVLGDTKRRPCLPLPRPVLGIAEVLVDEIGMVEYIKGFQA